MFKCNLNLESTPLKDDDGKANNLIQVTIRSEYHPDTFFGTGTAVKLPTEDTIPLYAANRATAKALRDMANRYDETAEMSVSLPNRTPDGREIDPELYTPTLHRDERVFLADRKNFKKGDFVFYDDAPGIVESAEYDGELGRYVVTAHWLLTGKTATASPGDLMSLADWVVFHRELAAEVEESENAVEAAESGVSLTRAEEVVRFHTGWEDDDKVQDLAIDLLSNMKVKVVE